MAPRNAVLIFGFAAGGNLMLLAQHAAHGRHVEALISFGFFVGALAAALYARDRLA